MLQADSLSCESQESPVTSTNHSKSLSNLYVCFSHLYVRIFPILGHETSSSRATYSFHKYLLIKHVLRARYSRHWGYSSEQKLKKKNLSHHRGCILVAKSKEKKKYKIFVICWSCPNALTTTRTRDERRRIDKIVSPPCCDRRMHNIGWAKRFAEVSKGWSHMEHMFWASSWILMESRGWEGQSYLKFFIPLFLCYF